jgi:hypothetical protein
VQSMAQRIEAATVNLLSISRLISPPPPPPPPPPLVSVLPRLSGPLLVLLASVSWPQHLAPAAAVVVVVVVSPAAAASSSSRRRPCGCELPALLLVPVALVVIARVVPSIHCRPRRWSSLWWWWWWRWWPAPPPATPIIIRVGLPPISTGVTCPKPRPTA